MELFLYYIMFNEYIYFCLYLCIFQLENSINNQYAFVRSVETSQCFLEEYDSSMKTKDQSSGQI